MQSLATGIYRPATIILDGQRAKVRFERGGEMVLELDNPATAESEEAESEEIVGVDLNDNYWAIYLDHKSAAPSSPSGAVSWHAGRPNGPTPAAGFKTAGLKIEPQERVVSFSLVSSFTSALPLNGMKRALNNK